MEQSRNGTVANDSKTTGATLETASWQTDSKYSIIFEQASFNSRQTSLPHYGLPCIPISKRQDGVGEVPAYTFFFFTDYLPIWEQHAQPSNVTYDDEMDLCKPLSHSTIYAGTTKEVNGAQCNPSRSSE